VTAGTAEEQAAGRVRYREVFGVGEWRALWVAQVISIAGDQFARIALAVLVYDRTRSPLLAAVTFAATAGAMFAGGLLLGWTADRWPRRQVMITADLICAGLVGVMIIPGLPLPVLIALLFAVGLAIEPYLSARLAINREVLGGRRFQLAQGVTMATYQGAAAAGYAAGGAVTGLLGVRPALAVDAASFAASALLLRLAVRRRPAPTGSGDARLTRPGIFHGVTVIGVRPIALAALGLLCLAAFYNAPEGITVPLGRQLGGGTGSAGLLLGAMAAGATIGPLAYTRLLGPVRGVPVASWCAAAACAVLILFALPTGLAGAAVILAASGFATGYIPAAVDAMMATVPDEHQGKAGGVIGAVMSLGQALGIVVAGAVAARVSPSLVLAGTGAAGTACAIPLIIAWRRVLARAELAKVAAQAGLSGA
jgi:predicted MFS family arabinose efflux permease